MFTIPFKEVKLDFLIGESSSFWAQIVRYGGCKILCKFFVFIPGFKGKYYSDKKCNATKYLYVDYPKFTISFSIEYNWFQEKDLWIIALSGFVRSFQPNAPVSHWLILGKDLLWDNLTDFCKYSNNGVSGFHKVRFVFTKRF